VVLVILARVTTTAVTASIAITTTLTISAIAVLRRSFLEALILFPDIG
jgi:hypothetical protein